MKTHLINNVISEPCFSLSDSQYSYRSMNKLTSGLPSLRKRAWKKSINSMIEQVGVIQRFNLKL